MSLPISIALISLCFNLLLGVLVILANPKRATNRQFLVFSTFGSLWLITLALSFASREKETFFVWFHATNVLGLFVLLGFSWVRIAMQDADVTLRLLIERSRFQIAVVAALSVFSITGFHVSDVSFPDVGIPNIVHGEFSFVYSLGYLFLALREVWLLSRAVESSRGIQRFELNFLRVGAGVMIVLGVLPILVVPFVAENSQGVAFAPLWIVFMDTAIAYGIATRRIMDVSAVFRRAVSWGLLGLYLVVCYGAVFMVMTKVTGVGSWDGASAIHSIVATAAVVLTFGWAQNRLDVFVNRTFVSKDRIDPMKDWEKAREALNKVTTTPQLIERFSDLLSQTAGTDRALIRLIEPNGLETAVDKRLQENPKPILTSALARQRDRDEDQALLAELKQGDWELTLGIYREDSLVGVVSLAERLSGRVYSLDEQRALVFLVRQFSGALENAMLYTTVANRELYNKTLLDNLASGVIATDLTGLVTQTNPEARSILEAHDSVVVLPSLLKSLLNEILKSGEAAHDVELEVVIDENTTRFVQVSGALLRNEDGSAIGALLVVNDVSAQRQLEKHVRHSDRLATIGKVSASVAHEIKNPLVTIKSFVQLLPERKTDEEFLQTFSRLVDSEVERIDTAIGGLLNYARSDSTQLGTVLLHAEVRGAVELLSAEFRKKRLEVKLDLKAVRDDIKGHAGQIKQMLVNLLLNANDALSDNGIVRIASRVLDKEGSALVNGSAITDSEFIEIRVEDNGQGIAEVDMNQVLMPFFTTKSGGTGLGLPLVASMVSQHDGKIDIESRVGEGTSIILRFSLQKSSLSKGAHSI